MSAAALAPERWRRVRPLLDRALDLDDGERAAFLEGLSGEAAEFRADLERLLRHHEVTARLARPAAELAATALERVTAGERKDRNLGRQIGPFRLTRLLGAGGMGAVYAAERVDGGFRQTVAIKLVAGVHPGMTARFERERQILADLRHPHIAQLLDGGETPDGMPYFALEYVEGEPIAEHVESRRLDVDGRVRLLVEVAEALAYAHRRGVIHRDLKPGNILVSAEGDVKLLDFGIAKLLNRTDQPTLTHHRVGPMTPEYAAPEQFRGAALGVHTDVYQFGVLMFRLLTGRLPYRAASDDGLAWARAVSEQEPMSLNEALRAQRRECGADVEVTLGRVEPRGGIDLNAVVRRCLAKAPAERYPGMEALIADLVGWLTPAAHRPRRSWRPLLFGAAAALVLAAVLAGGWRAGNPPESRPESSTAASSIGDWASHPALTAFGFRAGMLHVANPDSEAIIARALLAEAAGDAPAALALFEGAHRSDPATPVPALMLAYWGSTVFGRERSQEWLAEARRRIAPLGDPYLELFAGFVEADLYGSPDESLRFSAALLAMHPEAWFLHLARAHALTRVELPAAALRELQAIDVTRLGHRKLVDAIADRGALGDLHGAWAQFHRLETDLEDPQRAALQARLTYSSGDLAGARALYRDAVARARAVARMDIESRGLLWAGAFGVALGDDDGGAEADLRSARTRLGSRQQFRFASDAALLLAQLAHWRGDREAVAGHIADARELRARLSNEPGAGLIDLVDARLTGAAIPEQAAVDDDYRAALQSLLDARGALQRGDTTAARAALEQARNAGVGESLYVEEAALLARELGAPGFELAPIDPPFGPYVRYATRRELGAGASVVPAPRAAGALTGD